MLASPSVLLVLSSRHCQKLCNYCTWLTKNISHCLLILISVQYCLPNTSLCTCATICTKLQAKFLSVAAAVSHLPFPELYCRSCKCLSWDLVASKSRKLMNVYFKGTMLVVPEGYVVQISNMMKIMLALNILH